jgi:osmotically-inducible protein OsmY
MRLYNDVLEEVEGALMNDQRTRDAVIEVDNHNGIVTLSGVVRSPEIAAAAEEVASQQNGVIKVVNLLTVKDRTG